MADENNNNIPDDELAKLSPEIRSSVEAMQSQLRTQKVQDLAKVDEERLNKIRAQVQPLFDSLKFPRDRRKTVVAALGGYEAFTLDEDGDVLFPGPEGNLLPISIPNDPFVQAVMKEGGFRADNSNPETIRQDELDLPP